MKRIKPIKKKSKTLSWHKVKAWIAFSLFIRVRDCIRTTGCASWGLCISCDRRYHIKLLQAGHFIPGRHNANLFYKRGCHAQCYNCNINLKGNTLEYGDALVKLYGPGIIEELRENNKKSHKFLIPDLIEFKQELERDIKQFKNLYQDVA